MEKFEERLLNLAEKYEDIERRDFFRYVSYELTRDSFDQELHDHDLESWVTLFCRVKNLDENEYRENLWKYYCGFGVIPKLGL